MLGIARDDYLKAKAEAAERKTTGSNVLRAKLPEAERPRDVAAKAVGVSARTMQDAITVTEKAPELADKVRAGKMTVSAAARQVKRDETKAAIAAAPVVTEHVAGQRYYCIVIDPPWSPEDEGDVDQIGRAQPTYATMPISDIESLPVGDDAEPDCHIYLWITNRSLPKGFALLTAWGFRYVTTLTWCKPSIGVGNYFRNNTEHVLFGIRGSLPLAAQDMGTWFAAKRGPAGHSSKPDEFYDIVRRASPGPRAEWFGRQRREGFVQRLPAIEVAS
jgi:N6-adenosine-specific RNA methylase IME4